MKTRYLTLFLTAAGAVFALGGAGCSSSSTLDPNVQARLRNSLPSATQPQVARAPRRWGKMHGVSRTCIQRGRFAWRLSSQK